MTCRHTHTQLLLNANTDITQTGITYATAIGYGAIATTSNTIVLGGTGPAGAYPQVIIPSTTTATSATTGAVTIAGGLGVAGSIYAGVSVYANNVQLTSDYRLKENVSDLDDTFCVDKLRPVTYTHKKTQKQEIGLIAHELQDQYPYLVTGEKDGADMQSVNYNGLFVILIKEIKDLKQSNIELKQSNIELKQSNIELKQENKIIKERLDKLEIIY